MRRMLVPICDPAPHQQPWRNVFQDLAMSFKLPRTVTPELLSHRTVAGTCSWLALQPPTSPRSCIHLEHRQFYGRLLAPPCEQLLCVSEGLENALRRHRDFDFNNHLVLLQQSLRTFHGRSPMTSSAACRTELCLLFRIDVAFIAVSPCLILFFFECVPPSQRGQIRPTSLGLLASCSKRRGIAPTTDPQP